MDAHDSPADKAASPLDPDLFPDLQCLDPEFWGVEAKSVTLVSPLETFRAWFDAQPEMMQERIAGSLASFLGLHTYFGEEAPATADELPIVLRCWLLEDGLDYHQTLHRAAILRQAMNLGVFLHRGTKADWVLFASESVRHLFAARHEGNSTLIAICERGAPTWPPSPAPGCFAPVIGSNSAPPA